MISELKAHITRLSKWEYWPFSVLYFPVFFYFIWLAIKRRSLFFFTAANPTITFGGMMGEKKSDIFELIPPSFLPPTLLVKKGHTQSVAAFVNDVAFPLIAKPNIGERGNWIHKIDSQKQLDTYIATCPVDFLLQAYIDYPIELGVFYVRMPGEEGTVTSIVRKGFLEVEGDGVRTISELLHANERASINYNFQSDFIAQNGHVVLAKGKKLMAEPIGNHCRGTTFLDDNHQIDQALIEAFNQLSGQIPGFHFGRFDLRCRSYADLRQLKHFKILELNGAGAEPAHIYQPGASLCQAYRVIFWHLKVLSDISHANQLSGVRYWPFKKGVKMWQAHRRYNRLLAHS